MRERVNEDNDAEGRRAEEEGREGEVTLAVDERREQAREQARQAAQLSDTFTIVVVIWMIFGMPVYIGAFLLGVYVGKPLGSPTLLGMITGLGTMCAGVIASYAVIHRIVDRRFREIWLGHQFCPRCQYDLTGISPDRCPECGEPIPSKGAA